MLTSLLSNALMWNKHISTQIWSRSNLWINMEPNQTLFRPLQTIIMIISRNLWSLRLGYQIYLLNHQVACFWLSTMWDFENTSDSKCRHHWFSNFRTISASSLLWHKEICSFHKKMAFWWGITYLLTSKVTQNINNHTNFEPVLSLV